MILGSGPISRRIGSGRRKGASDVEADLDNTPLLQVAEEPTQGRQVSGLAARFEWFSEGPAGDLLRVGGPAADGRLVDSGDVLLGQRVSPLSRVGDFGVRFCQPPASGEDAAELHASSGWPLRCQLPPALRKRQPLTWDARPIHGVAAEERVALGMERQRRAEQTQFYERPRDLE